MQTTIDDSWKPYLDSEFDQPYMRELHEFLKAAHATTGFYPPAPLVFNALRLTPLDTVRVLILGLMSGSAVSSNESVHL